MVKKFRRYVYSFWHDPRTWQTDGQTLHADTGRAYASHRAAIKWVFNLQVAYSICTWNTFMKLWQWQCSVKSVVIITRYLCNWLVICDLLSCSSNGSISSLGCFICCSINWYDPEMSSCFVTLSASWCSGSAHIVDYRKQNSNKKNAITQLQKWQHTLKCFYNPCTNLSEINF